MSILQGKVALITGGSSGIGLATAREFHAQGARVVLSGRDRQRLEAVATQLGSDVLAVPTDVTRLSDLDNLMARTRETFGNLDILFVNAGITGNRTLAETDEAFFDEQMNTNFKGAYFTIQKALPLLNDQASIILTGSVSALVGMAGTSVYSASKAALHSLARTFSAELIGHGIRVNTITTGAIETPILERAGNPPEVVEKLHKMFASRVPIKRMGRPEEVAKVALFLASSDSSFVVGTEIAADGGNTANIRPLPLQNQ
ncbi:short-chain dehydrogenase [Ktedonobacter sp. SOSP1-52]|uniref:SDR family oxidoreductase n=1 Tax=Ktedonobacter sp. SOSP1-52 TaxID=2778366 RepID=UPI001915D0E9|nr:SDR family oxidoreductase [Ktedonobacter sp. SOSP1-52]GHO63035.1 short-chain dehydrogenase [Ktedonobacter sp. SOSP1-52]